MQLFFIIPHFSFAMASMVAPSLSVWSRLMGVIPATSGFTTFVASSLPPRPTSTTAISTFLMLKNKNASAV